MEPLLFWIIAGTVTLVSFVILLLLLRLINAGTASKRAGRNTEIEDSTDGVFGSLTPALAAQIPESEQESTDFSQLLRRAGLYSPSARSSIYALRFILLFLPLVIALVAGLLVPEAYAFPVVIIGGIIAAALSILPRFYVFLRQRTRVREIRQGLADMMDMLSMCLSGGLPVGASLEHVARNLVSYPSLSQELQIMRRQAEVGSLKHALRDFAQRVNIPEVRQLSNLLSRGDQLGTQLSGSLHEQADHFRETRKQMATLQANRAPVKLTFPLVFCFAPAALILLMAPAILEITDFARNSEEFLGQSQIRQMQQLEQQESVVIGQARPTSDSGGDSLQLGQ